MLTKNYGGHHLGLAKIAYEVSHYWLGDCWMDDPVAISMRDALNGDSTAGDSFKVFEDGNDGQQTTWDPNRTHALVLHKAGTGYVVNIRLLNVFSAYFVVTRSPEKYQHPKTDAILMDAVERNYVEAQVQIDPEHETPSLRLI